MTAESIESELKLALPPSASAALAAHPLFAAASEPRTSRLHAVYFDTPDLALWQRGLTLRVRREGRKFTQALKGRGAAQAGLHRRIELEARTARDTPDIALFAENELGREIASAIAEAALVPVCVTGFSRTTRLLQPGDGTRIEASFDRGTIEAAGRTERVCELELELKAGKPRALYDLALTLLETMPLKIENRAKAERGYALYRGDALAPRKAAAITLEPAMSVPLAFSAVLRGALTHLQANERGLLTTANAEYLHQMRVALRRMRAAFLVFRGVADAHAGASALVDEMRWLESALGPARDLDVLLDETLPPILSQFDGHPGLERYGSAFSRARLRAWRAAKSAVASARYQRFILAFGAWLEADSWADVTGAPGTEQPLAAYAAAVLQKRYEKVRQRGRKLPERSAAELHRLRIAVKKLRYSALYFAMLFESRKAPDMLDVLGTLQEDLGAINDAEMLRRHFDSVLAGKRRDVQEARGIALGWARSRVHGLRREVGRTWKCFRACGRFWQARVSTA